MINIRKWLKKDRFLNRLSIRRKLLIILAVQFVILISWYGYMVHISVAESKNQRSTAAQQLNNRVLSDLSGNVLNMNDISTFPVLHTSESSEFIYNYLSIGDHSNEYQYDMNVDQQINYLLGIYQAPIDQIYIFDVEGAGIGRNRQSLTYINVKTDLDAKWATEAFKAYGKAVLLGSGEVSNETHVKDQNHIYVARAIINAESYKPVGIILVGCNIKTILSSYQSPEYNASCFGIYAIDGRLLYGSTVGNEAKIHDYVQSIDNKSTTSSAIAHYEKGNWLLNYGISQSSQIVSVVRIPSVTYSVDLRQYSFWIMIAVLFLFSLAFLTVFLQSIINPINSIVVACGKISKGDFKVMLPTNEAYEITELSNAFNQMTAEIDSLINDQYLRNITERDLELQMLRSQINPHFLYNTLESMRMTAYIHNESDLAQMCVSLANILRYGVTSSNEEVTVRAEIDHMNEYIRLETLLCGDRFEFVSNIQDSLQSKRIIKLVLQPIIENALFHGIASKVEKGRIMVLGYLQGADIVFKIVDNGAGMSPELIDDLNGYIQGKNDHFQSIGLKNVHRRIRLYYGEAYGLLMESVLNRGTSVTVTLPAQGEKEDENSV